MNDIYILSMYYVNWFSGLLCNNNASCNYWAWNEDINGSPQYCYLKSANFGLDYVEGAISGRKTCIAPEGKGA